MGCLLLSEPWFIAWIFHHSKGTPNVFTLGRTLRWQEKSFFLISGKSSTELVRTTRAKEPFHKHHNQEFERFPVPPYHQNRECATGSLWLRSGNELWLVSKLEFSYKYGRESNRFPLHLGALVRYREFPLCERHFKRVLLSIDGSLGMTIPCFHKWEKQHRAEWPLKKLQKTRDCLQHGCFIHSLPHTDSISNVSLLRKAMLASFPHKLLLSWWQRHQCPASTLWSTGVRQGVSFAWRHSKSVLCRGSDLSWEVLLEISEKLVCTTRAKQTLLKHHQQVIGSDLDATYVQLCEKTLAQMHLCSGKQHLLFPT